MVLIFRLIVSPFILFLLHCILISKCETFKSIESLTELASNEDPILGLREFQRKRMDELEKLQRTIEFLEEDHAKALEDVLDYLSNPINAFKLIKRMVVDWKEIHNYVEDAQSTKDFAYDWGSYVRYVELPDESDLQDAIEGLTSVETGIDGAGSDIIHGSKMTWDECYEIGIRLYDRNKYTEAYSWLEQALEKVPDSEEYAAIRIDIMEYIAFSQYMLGNVNGAAVILGQALEIPVVNSTVVDSMPYFLLNRRSVISKIVLQEPHYTQNI